MQGASPSGNPATASRSDRGHLRARRWRGTGSRRGRRFQGSQRRRGGRLGRRRLRLRRRDPDSGKHREQADDEVERDRLAHEDSRERCRRDGVHRHGIGDARRTGVLQRHHPQNEGQRASAGVMAR